MLTLQEIFDKVSHHLLKQKARSMISSSTGGSQLCAYRGSNGLCCAVGFLIPDDKYDPNMEGGGICDIGEASLLVRNVLYDSGIDVPRDAGYDSELYNEMTDTLFEDCTPTLALLLDLQRMHDEQPVEAWPAVLGHIALNHGLELKEVADVAS